MTRKYYVGLNNYGTNCSSDSVGWTVIAFSSKKERYDWLDKNEYDTTGNIVAEKITRRYAEKIIGSSKLAFATIGKGFWVVAKTQYEAEMQAFNM